MAAELGDDEAVAACFQEFCGGIIEGVADAAACVKPQAAFFEQYGAAGWKALSAVIRCAHEHELPVILDVKRGDIASTAPPTRTPRSAAPRGSRRRPPGSEPTPSPRARTWATTHSSLSSSTAPPVRACSC